MKRILLYEFKRNLLPLVIFSVISVALCVIFPMSVMLSDSQGNPINSCLGMFVPVLCVLCSVTPVMQCSYRMRRRSVDLWYSVPVSRKQLLFVRTLIGLALALIPYTLGYWLGAMVVALRASVRFIWYLPCFAVTLLLGVGLYGVNAFLFTRANSIGDGLFFVAAWACILPAVLAAMASLGWDFVYRPFVGGVSLQRLSDTVFTYSGMAWGVTPFEYFICADAIDYETCVRACVASVLAVSEAVAAYVLLFVRADRDQAEDAEQISSSWWGYRILIPVYVVCLMCFIPPDFRWDNIFLMAIVLVGAFIGFFAYRRSFRLQRSDFISIGVTYAVGILLMLIGG